MAYKIGKIELLAENNDFNYKFLINSEGDDFVFYSCQYSSETDLPNYDEIAGRFGLEHVVGIGSIDHGGGGKKVLGIWSGSRDHEKFRSISREIMKNFERMLLDYFKSEICQDIETVDNICLIQERLKK